MGGGIISEWLARSSRNLEGSVWSRGAKAWVFNGATTLKPD